MNCQQIDCIVHKVIFEGPKKVKYGCFATFCQFSQKRTDNFCIPLLVYHINQMSRDRIYLIIRKVMFKIGKVRFSPFSHNFPLILFSSKKGLPKFIASCIFSV